MAVKNDILKILENSKGSFISGNDIASQLNITRAAVWKAIRSLEEMGYKIKAVSKKGYCLDESNDILSAQSIMPFINNSSLYSDILVHQSIGSTNQEAKDLANQGAKSGTTVIAEEQTNGRGRLGRSFFSPNSSGIYMSVIYRLDVDIQSSMLITSAAAVAVSRAIKKICDIDCQIKWVNDVYINGKKVCGILTEASMNFENKSLDYIVIGIGINVLKSSFPEDLSNIVTSLEENMDSKTISRSKLIGEILNELEIVLSDLHKKDFLIEYKNLSFILGSEVNVISSISQEICLAIDINEMGHLIVKDKDGNIKTISSGEVSIRKC